MDRLTEYQRDQLKEIFNIGSGNASTALSDLVGERVGVSVVEMYIGKVEDLLKTFSSPESLMTIVLFKITGHISGITFFLFHPQDALELSKLINKGGDADREAMTELDQSALLEVGNIVSGSALSAISNTLKIDLVNTIPDSATDMLGSEIVTVLSEMGDTTEKILLCNVEFKVENKDISGKMYYMYDRDATVDILEAVKKTFSA